MLAVEEDKGMIDLMILANLVLILVGSAVGGFLGGWVWDIRHKPPPEAKSYNSTESPYDCSAHRRKR